MSLKKNPITFYTLIIILLGYASLIILFPPINILSWDIFGYYLYLPFKFIYDDLGLRNQETLNEIIHKYNSTASFYQAGLFDTGNWVIRYSCGASILYSPFFFIAHAFCKLTGYYPADGFSAPYQYAILYGCAFYTFTGIYFLAKILLTFFNDLSSALALVIITIGTNYFLHTILHGQGAMSHNFEFTLYTLLIWYCIKWHNEFKINQAIVIGLLCGLITLIRPSEIVCCFIPLLWDFKSIKTQFIKLYRHKLHLILIPFCAFIVLFIQLIYWKSMTGKWIVDSYTGNEGEGFEFLHPFFIEVLFSFRKGWFIYTPIMILAILGFIPLRKQKNLFVPICVFFVFSFYIISSWSNWWYAASFGQRSLIPAYSILAIPMGSLIQHVIQSKRILIKGMFILFSLLCIYLNIFQTIQLNKGIIHTHRMSKEYYMKTFGKLTPNEDDKKYLLVDRPADGNEIFSEYDKTNYIRKKCLYNDFEDSTEIASNKICHEFAYSGKTSQAVFSPDEYSSNIQLPFNELTSKDHVWLKISCKVFVPDSSLNAKASLCATFLNRNKCYKFKSLNLFDSNNNINPNKWTEISFYYLSPEIRLPTNLFTCFFWNQSKNKIYIDDLRVDVYERKF